MGEVIQPVEWDGDDRPKAWGCPHCRAHIPDHEHHPDCDLGKIDRPTRRQIDDVAFAKWSANVDYASHQTIRRIEHLEKVYGVSHDTASLFNIIDTIGLNIASTIREVEYRQDLKERAAYEAWKAQNRSGEEWRGDEDGE